MTLIVPNVEKEKKHIPSLDWKFVSILLGNNCILLVGYGSLARSRWFYFKNVWIIFQSFWLHRLRGISIEGNEKKLHYLPSLFRRLSKLPLNFWAPELLTWALIWKIFFLEKLIEIYIFSKNFTFICAKLTSCRTYHNFWKSPIRS